MKRKRVLRNLRIASLFAALIAVTYFTIVEDRRFRAWNKTIKVAIYPIEVENNPSVSAYIESLTPDAFADIGKFLSFQSIEYGVAAPAGGLFKFSLMPRLSELPPSQPPQSASMFEVAIYSLKMRFWVLKLVHLEGRDDGDLRLFVLYHNAEPGRALPHSLGLKKGRIGIVNAFAENKSTKPNAVIMAHELLHTLGASDKYDAEGEPLFPLGYADPAQRPQTPQRQGEIMSGRIPVSEGVSKIIGRLDDAVIGPETAKEIFWLKD